jgi:hypothetical protein
MCYLQTNKIISKSVYFFVLYAFLIQSEVFAMGSFGMKLCVFSSVKGTVLKDGQPIKNALVKRTYKWNGESFTDQQTTNEIGQFAFPDAFQKSLMTFFPHNPAVTQLIKIHVDNTEYQAWGFQKGNYDVNGELNGKALQLKCELNNPEQPHNINPLKSYIGFCELI